MKHLYTLLGILVFCLPAITPSFAQEHFRKNISEAEFFKPLNVPERPKSNLTHSGRAPFTFFLDYATADENAWNEGSNSYIWSFNTSLDTNQGRKYFVVAFDSVCYAGKDNNIGFPYSTISKLTIDSVFAQIGQQNKSGKDDTLRLKVVAVDTNGYPTDSILWSRDSIIKASSPLSKGNNWLQPALLKWKCGYEVPKAPHKFAIRLEYFGNSKDLCGFIASFEPNMSTCKDTTLKPPLADSTHFSKILRPGMRPFFSNSFALWNPYKSSGILPTSTGGDIYYDCDTSKSNTKGDGKNYIQNIWLFPKVTFESSYDVLVPEYSMGLTLKGSYPNPAQEFTIIRYNVMEASAVSVQVYNLMGQPVQQSLAEKVSAGNHEMKISTKDFPAGNYFYTVKTEQTQLTGRFAVIK